jgi:hypothetical protein
MDERLHRVERELRWIKRYTASVAIILGAMLMAAFQQADRSRFTEIDVERLNIVEKDGTLRLAIANPERVPPIMFYGKEYPGLRGGSAPGAAGMIYFNEEGSEVGGYLWRGRTLEDGSHTAAGFLTFDQYNQGETLTLTYVDRNGQRRAGLSILDQPGGSIQPALDSLMITRRMEAVNNMRRQNGRPYTTRLFAGKDPSKSAVVSLADLEGRPRLRLLVDSTGVPKLEFLDEDGKVTHQLPEHGR